MRAMCILIASLAAAACVPADEALPLGSAEFTITARYSARTATTVDGWSINIDRYVMGFRTITIVNLEDSDQCSYRGRGADANLIFDGTTGSVIQSFNGIKPGPCPDVGLRLSVPDDYTRVGEGTTVDDLLALASNGQHAFVDVTATKDDQTVHLEFRFDPGTTSNAFANCRDATRGAKIEPEGRDAIFVEFDALAFFRERLITGSDLSFSPFALADQDDDGTITMAELDATHVVGGFGSLAYTLPNGQHTSSLGEWVRTEFQASVHFGNGGTCDGLPAGTPLDQ